MIVLTLSDNYVDDKPVDILEYITKDGFKEIWSNEESLPETSEVMNQIVTAIPTIDAIDESVMEESVSPLSLTKLHNIDLTDKTIVIVIDGAGISDEILLGKIGDRLISVDKNAGLYDTIDSVKKFFEDDANIFGVEKYADVSVENKNIAELVDLSEFEDVGYIDPDIDEPLEDYIQ